MKNSESVIFLEPCNSLRAVRPMTGQGVNMARKTLTINTEPA